jgi:DNA repair exonuclease SbcCD ATPase subunit
LEKVRLLFDPADLWLTLSSSVDALLNEAKQASVDALEQSRETLKNLDDDLNMEYKEIETARLDYERLKKEADQAGRSPPSSDGVDLRPLETLTAELEERRAQLEIMLATNPGIVEQYEKRKRDVSPTRFRSHGL